MQKPAPAKLAGGIITVIIWLATLAYIIWTLYQWFTRPIEINNTIDWMVGNGEGAWRRGPVHIQRDCLDE